MFLRRCFGFSGAALALLLGFFAPPASAMVTLDPRDLSWENTRDGKVRFQARFRNLTSMSSEDAQGRMSSQDFGVYLPNFGPIGSFQVPPLEPQSFFDVFFEVERSALPPSAREMVPGRPEASARAVGIETGPTCPPDDHWDGNVDVIWTEGGQTGQVHKHFGTLQVCPGGGNSYIHFRQFECDFQGGASWMIKGLCQGFTATLVNEDLTPAPNPVPPGWTGWICVSADATVPVGVECCLEVNFDCGGQPATIDLCATTCQWQKGPSPVPNVLNWLTTAAGTVQFQVRWENPDPTQPSAPAQGEMRSQEFGVFMPNFGPIGTFDVPAIPPTSFFDVFFEVELASLPPSAREMVPGRPGASARTVGIETGPTCPPDDHWDGNVDVVWTSGGQTGQVNVHYGTLQVCPGGGNSYIHVRQLLCDVPGGVSWMIKGLCQGFTATLVNEDLTPAPNPLPAGWSGWICVSADPAVPVGVECCLKVNFDCGGQPATVDLCVTTCQWEKAPQPVPNVLDWLTTAAGTVQFQIRWENPDRQQPSAPVQGEMRSQEFGVFMPNFGPIGTFDVPAIPPTSFFDVFFEVELASLPPSAREMVPGRPGSARTVGIETDPPCPPDDHWDGNVDVVWGSAAGQGGQVNVHYGTLQVCPGGGASYIHIKQLLCDVQGGASWTIKDLCPGFTATVVNEDLTPAPNPVPPGWTGWICVTADPTVPVGVECCLKVNFDCGGVPAEIRLCAVTCQWQKAPPPVPNVLDWVTTADGSVRFQVRWENPDPDLESLPVQGEMRSQEFGVFMPNFGPIGTFAVPPIPPTSFFDVFFEVDRASLPPSAREMVPGRPGSARTVGIETDPPCPPDDHWDGNVDVVWDTPKGPGQVNVHYGTLQVCPGGGASYIHIRQLLCDVQGGASWAIKDLCPGFSATLVNEDLTPAPNPVPPGWTGWICVTADPAVPVGVDCCLKVNFDCGGRPAQIRLCATTCQWEKAPPPVPQVLDWITTAAGTVRFQVRWTNPDPQLESLPVRGRMSSQEFGVFMPNFRPIGDFEVPPLRPRSFFDVFFEVGLPDLPPSAREIVPGRPEPAAGAIGIETGPQCPPDDHWDGNVDIVWNTPKGPGEVNAHYGTLQVCQGGGASYIHIRQLLCDFQGGASWAIKDLCPGFTATLVNEDLTPAPNPVPPGWTGWICVRANATVPVGTQCCLKVNFDCGGRPAEIVLCATACCFGKLDVPPLSDVGELGIRSAIPNPTRGSVEITYAAPRAGEARLEVFDAAGKRVRTLLDGPVGAGIGTATWNGRGEDGRGLSAGLYFVRLSLGGESASKKVLLVD